MKVAKLHDLEVLEFTIAAMVLRGRAELAREFAADYALMRDSRLTDAENTARWSK